MVEIIFSYNQIETIIQANLDDSFDLAIQKYVNKTQLDINNIYFVSSGNIISKNGKIMNIMNDSEKGFITIPLTFFSLFRARLAASRKCF